MDAELARSGWRGVDLARRLGVGQNIVSLWRTGKQPVPGYVQEYLRVMLLAKEILKP